jgi:uncharacterized protein YjdB
LDDEITLEKGENCPLFVEVLPVRATDKRVKWSSSNTDIATVNEAGVVTAAGGGSAIITATAFDGSGASDTCKINVNVPYIPVTGVTLNKAFHMFKNAGYALQLTETVIPSDATNKSVAWKSSNESVAAVSPSGLVTANYSGFAAITVTTNDGNYTDTCTVFVNAPNTGNMIPLKPALPVGAPIGTGIISTEPIIIVPADSSDISLESDMLSSMMPSFNPEDFHVNEYGVITIEDWIAKEIKKKLLGIDQAEVVTIPVFEAVLNNPGETAAVSFMVKGSHLMIDELISRPEKVRLMNLLSADSGDWYTYTGTAGGLTDKTFTILDMNNNIFTGDLDADGDYILVFLIKDGGSFDLDKQVDGAVWGVLALVGVPVTGVTLTPVTLNLTLGNSYDLSAGVSIMPSIADNPRVIWSSNSPYAVSVDRNGVITATGAGTATIVVTTVNGGFTDSCAVTTFVPVTNITGVPDTATAGTPLALTGTVEPPDATNKTITWSVSNPGTTGASITGSTLNTTSAGTAVVTSTIANGTAPDTNYEKDFNITVNEEGDFTYVKGVTLNKSYLELHIGNSETLIATVLPLNATDKNVTWYCDNPYVATIDATGLVTAISAGYANITVTTADGGFTAECYLRVTIPASSITIDPTAVSIDVGNIYLLMASLLPFNVSDSNVVWSSSNTDIATVTQGGLVRGIAGGKVTITATAFDGSGVSGTSTVNVIAPYVPVTEVVNVGDIIPMQTELPAGTPVSIGGSVVVSIEPIIFIPADSSDISLEIDMLSSMMSGISPADLHINEYGVITIEDWRAKEAAEKLLSMDKAEVITIPVFEAVLNNPGEIAAVSFQVKGRHLMVDGLISRPENVRLLGMLSADSGDWYTYTGTADGLADKTFTILDMSNNIFTGDLAPDGDYILLFLIKDGGSFDLDKQADGSVWGVSVLVGVPVTAETFLPAALSLSRGGIADILSGISIPIPYQSAVFVAVAPAWKNRSLDWQRTFMYAGERIIRYHQLRSFGLGQSKF